MIFYNYKKLYWVILQMSVLILFGLFSCNTLRTDTDIHGTWEGKQNNHEVSFIFKSDKTCIINFFDKQSNKYETINGSYILDFSKKPISLSIQDIQQLNHSLYTIVEFSDYNLIKIAGFSPKWRLRPISFNAEDTINLKRVSKQGEKK